jgi:TetR/AcrR family transcriptional regulator, regulator of autoinduction and epiphytic fitness
MDARRLAAKQRCCAVGQRCGRYASAGTIIHLRRVLRLILGQAVTDEVDYGSTVANSMSVGHRLYRSSQREEQARLTRRRVLDAASAVFLERGFAGSTMRLIAHRAGVSLPTVELLFGTKGRLLKATIDVAIAGDDEPVAVLQRSWTEAAARADTVPAFLAVVAGVLGPAQQRSAGLVLAVFEAASTDAELADLARQMTIQRATTAGWIVDELRRRAPLRVGSTRSETIDTVWVLMDPAVFDRLTRRRGWTLRRYQRWFASSVAHLLTADAARPTPSTKDTTTLRRRVP